MKLLQLILSAFITVATIGYAATDYTGVWDNRSGRTAASKGIDRMGSALGLQETVLWPTDPEFYAVMKFILSYSKNPEIKKRAGQGVMPDCMTSVGDAKEVIPVPREWQKAARLASFSPVGVLYNAERVGNGWRGKHGQPWEIHEAGQLDEMSGWITQSRTKEKFWVTTGFLGALSFVGLLMSIIQYKATKNAR